MSAIDTLFQQLKREGRKALMPFITAGDPDLAFSGELLAEMVRRGAHLCELGIPYSDPIADGPVIQASYTRALDRKIKLAQIFEMARGTLPKLAAPVVTMASYAIIYRHGIERYIADAQTAGFAGAIVPDLLVEEAGEMSRLCRQADFSLVQLITPTTPRDRALRIAESSTGFVYYVSVTGITGERTELPAQLVDSVAWLRERTPLPVCIGFGISTAEHVKRLAPVADGLIVGSAIVRRVAEVAPANRQQVLRGIGDFVAELIAAL
ncbi:MAG TPA: tryptophan synthase subunit alpha [Pirellulales bacterium]|jgi:tryptophan synthase alpha chain|nr:tryptophan synthase subunit alpha [Pirellulales bacterium]